MGTMKFNRWLRRNGTPVGTVMQVIHQEKSDTFLTSTLYQNGGVVIPGLSATITPFEASSKILLLCSLNVGGYAAQSQVYTWIARGETRLGVGAAVDGHYSVGGRYYFDDNNVSGMIFMQAMDSPGITDPVTYDVRIGAQLAYNVAVNRTINDRVISTAPDGTRMASHLTIMEIAA